MANPTIERKQHTIDASGRSLGRLASDIAVLLRGKHKPSFQPHVDGGDFVEVDNVDLLRVTGQKETDKMYYRHSEYPGGLKAVSYKSRIASENGFENVLSDAVFNMLPNNRLRQHMMKRLTFKRSK